MNNEVSVFVTYPLDKPNYAVCMRDFYDVTVHFDDSYNICINFKGIKHKEVIPTIGETTIHSGSAQFRITPEIARWLGAALLRALEGDKSQTVKVRGGSVV